MTHFAVHLKLTQNCKPTIVQLKKNDKTLVALVVKNPPANAGDMVGSISGLGRFPWRRKRQPTPVFLPGEFHGPRSLAGYSPWGCKESDVTKGTKHLP